MSSLYFSATKNLFSFKLGPNSPPSTENSLDVQTPNPSIVKSILFLLATYRLPRAARFLFDPGGKNARERILREASSTKKGVFFTVLNSQERITNPWLIVWIHTSVPAAYPIQPIYPIGKWFTQQSNIWKLKFTIKVQPKFGSHLFKLLPTWHGALSEAFPSTTLKT